MQEWHHRWATEVLRVAKPGAMLLAFGGTRTWHRLACALEDAGWQIRDTLCWLYGSGFPKSLQIDKALDKMAGVDTTADDRWQKADEGYNKRGPRHAKGSIINQVDHHATDANPEGVRHLYVPQSEAAKSWQGYGTALKPAFEPIVVAMKPLDGTFAENALKHGVAGLNVDGCRIGVNAGWAYPNGRGGSRWHDQESLSHNLKEPMQATGGRWPANVVLSHTPECRMVGSKQIKNRGTSPEGVGTGDEHEAMFGKSKVTSTYADADGLETIEAWECSPDCPVGMFPQSDSHPPHALSGKRERQSGFAMTSGNGPIGDSGSASRFFYCAKASRSERGEGNSHPTVKPLDLLSWLCKLVSQPGHQGVLLDPFVGSGSTLLAATRWHGRAIGIEREENYCRIAAQRLR